ncbi:MarR family transcriptional regulator [Calidifontibacter sp. DB0510]|uniref:MarR family transcriptional regulator n=1 Tax=Metallococcus carri TaxID=1656884 RepID=A0A967B124_9MICO|nr:MarR family transcriptional regulator [Metallococcus carri]NHN55315.1 MarR family transcriptional regulator [Metallococcus carri]NOP36392.1 MarR family transcriptional regulator [Calidifontibacter sp. DB2511S]
MTGETPWLTDAQQIAWRNYLRGARALEVRLDAELQARSGMSLAEYELLSMLSEAPSRRMRMSALADMVIQSRSRVTHTANRLQERDWVRRQPCANDGRGVELVLTAAGLAAVKDASDVHVRGVQEHLIGQLSAEEFATVGNAMAKVRAGLT